MFYLLLLFSVAFGALPKREFSSIEEWRLDLKARADQCLIDAQPSSEDSVDQKQMKLWAFEPCTKIKETAESKEYWENAKSNPEYAYKLLTWCENYLRGIGRKLYGISWTSFDCVYKQFSTRCGRKDPSALSAARASLCTSGSPSIDLESKENSPTASSKEKLKAEPTTEHTMASKPEATERTTVSTPSKHHQKNQTEGESTASASTSKPKESNEEDNSATEPPKATEHINPKVSKPSTAKTGRKETTTAETTPGIDHSPASSRNTPEPPTAEHANVTEQATTDLRKSQERATPEGLQTTNTTETSKSSTSAKETE